MAFPGQSDKKHTVGPPKSRRSKVVRSGQKRNLFIVASSEKVKVCCLQLGSLSAPAFLVVSATVFHLLKSCERTVRPRLDPGTVELVQGRSSIFAFMLLGEKKQRVDLLRGIGFGQRGRTPKKNRRIDGGGYLLKKTTVRGLDDEKQGE